MSDELRSALRVIMKRVRVMLTDPFCILLLGYVVIILATVAVFILGAKNAAWIIGWGGILLWQAGFVVYIVFFDARKRWPGVSAFERFARLMTFYSERLDEAHSENRGRSRCQHERRDNKKRPGDFR